MTRLIFRFALIGAALLPSAGCGDLQPDESGEVLNIPGDQLAEQDFALSFGGTSAPSYSCTDDIGQTPTCSCTGYVDCRRLVNSGRCRDPQGVTVLKCPIGGSTCSCEWQQRATRPTVRWRSTARISCVYRR